MAARVGVESFGPQVGSAYVIGADDHADVDAPVVEEPDGRMALRDPDSAAGVRAPVAFVDGVRRGDARLSVVRDGGRMAFGAAGAYGVGAVRCEPGAPPRFAHLATRRLVVWGGGERVELPPVRGGFGWDCVSVASAHPDAPLDELQQRMRQAEGVLAEALCAEGVLTVVDGPLSYVRSRDLPVVGYVKTHHRAVLAADEHRRVPGLRAGQRTSLFAKRTDVYACYLRVAEPPAWGGPWAGIVRLELPASVGLAAAAATADRAALLLPRYAGVPHLDGRAPVNLQPIAKLESRLRHLLGDAALAVRAVRQAALRVNEVAA
ncbi:MAG TPA: hypothetical protein VM324_06605 [Egibacteraceae bacterium]|nr:hypothetical protein [Egibacteraceae bacterium]